MRRGFTLVEMMVALFIFGLLTAAGVAAMSFTATNQEVVRARVARVAELQRARAILKTDLAQAAARRVRTPEGRADLNVVFGDPADAAGPMLTFVRRGRENPDGAPRSSLQAVEYRIVQGRLERRVRSAPDGTALGAPQPLIRGVRSARIAYRTRGQWAPAFRGFGETSLPQAVRLELDLEGVGPVAQTFLVSGDVR